MRALVTIVILTFMALWLNGCFFLIVEYYDIYRKDNSHAQTHGLDVPTNMDSIRKINTIDLQSYETKYAGEDGVYLGVDRTFENLTYGSKSNYGSVDIRRIRYLILNPDDKVLSTFECEVRAGQELKNMFALVISPSGVIKQYSIADCKIQETESGKTYRIAYPDIKKGTIVEEGTEITNASSTEFFFQYAIPIEHMNYKHVFPMNRTFNQRKTGPASTPQLTSSTIQTDGITIRSYSASDISAWRSEPYGPYRKEVVPYYEFGYTSTYSGGNYDWSNIGGSFTYYSADNIDHNSKNVEAFARKLTANCKDKTQMMDTVVLWVQSHVKSVTSNDPEYESVAKEMDFEDVLDDGRGTQLIVMGLTQQMLRTLDMEASFVLLCNKSDGYFDESDPSVASFWGHGLQVKFDGKSFLVFPNDKDIPPNYVPEIYHGCRALQISGWWKETSQYFIRYKSTANFITLETDNMTASREYDKFDLNIGDDGLITVKESQTYYGNEAHSLRKELKPMKEDAIKQKVREMLTYTEGEIKVNKYTVEGKNSPLIPLVISVEYTINNLVTVTPEEVIFQTAGLFSPSSEAKSKFETSKRINPIQIKFDELLVKDISLSYPPSWNVTTAFTDVNIVNDLGSASVKYTTEPTGKLNVKIERLLKRTQQPKEKFPDLINLVGTRSTVQVPTILFKIK